ncbi:MAG: hypothetical protein QN178_07630 [Armatimonadota bacterium]|nr:hypothetical protein [Armatimonadota bacterium]
MRLWVSQLADPRARRTAARALLAVCVVGFVATMAVLVGFGYGLTRWIFVLLVWTVLIFVPLRIGLESAEALGARTRRRLADRLAADPERYEKTAHLPVLVEHLAARYVTMPRICTPQHAHAAREAAVALIRRTNATPAPRARLRDAIRGLLAVLGHDAVRLSAAVTGIAADNIQARWAAARALGTLGALVTILVAAYEDRWGEMEPLSELAGRTRDAYLAAVMDYCDEAAIEVDAMPWTEPPLTSDLPVERVEAIHGTWTAFLAAGLPAPGALEMFTTSVLQARAT